MNHCYAKMATSSQREGGRESAPPTPSKSSTEKSADNDIWKLIAGEEEEEERPTHLQGESYTLKQDDSQSPQVKEKEEELWTTQEGECPLGLEEADPTKLPLTVVSVKTEDQEDKLPESSRWFCPADVHQVIGRHEQRSPQLQGCSILKEEDPQPPHVKGEVVELWITLDGERLLGQEEADLTKLSLTDVSVKTEDHEDKPPESSLGFCPADMADLTKLSLTVKIEEKPPESSQLHHSPSEENRGVERQSSSSPQHMTTEADGDHCGGSQADNLLAPQSDAAQPHPDSASSGPQAN
ncbi:uncharacterized protein LOC129179197 isoform X2 [Dunckerocampus dactyliophorus]|uniref:uncharacterized protein LOC129179197 isoform X2 n=1 Tax=Dunckerocampus dactyliophorus TaxID=161453 RepID=UPI002406C857|nr:uncharacterized protein LOC129179197 isoform X2 [Dunckerocampus dactyliophorus]